MGHTNVVVYNEGLPEWVKRGYPAVTKKIYPSIEIPTIPAAELKRMLDARQPLVVLDVRDEETYQGGHVPGARWIDLEVLDQRVGELPAGKKVVVVDLHGKQTLIAGRYLAWKGFRDVVRLDGGFVGGWVSAGYPVER